MNAPQVNALTVDVEDYFQVAAFSKSIDRSEWNSIAPRVVQNTQRLLDVFDEAQVSATFFVLGWVAERFPKLVSEIHGRGHEVACHGFGHELIYRQSVDDFRDETVRSKAVLEEITGAQVAGYRAASYSITARSLWALDVIADAGFQYDSSIVPVRHDLYGMAGARPVPHELRTAQGRKIVEFPPTTFRLLGQRLPVGGGGYFRLYPYWLTAYLLRQVNRSRSPFIFYLHPWEIDPQQPRVSASWLSRFRHYCNLDKTEQRLRRLLFDFRFTTVRQVLHQLDLLRTDCKAAGPA